MTATQEAPRLYAEAEDGSTQILQLRRHRNYGKRFFTMFVDTCSILATLDRPTVYHRVLWQSMTMLDPVQWRRVSAPEIAEAANISLASANRALAMLHSDKVILHKGRASAKSMRLNNRICWHSNSEKWNAAPPDPEVVDSRGR